MDENTTRMVFATAALVAVAVLAGPAGAQIPEGTGAQPVTAQSDGWQAQSRGDYVVPYLSQGVGVDKAQFSGTASRTLADQASAQPGLDVAIKTAIDARSQKANQVEQQTIPYLSHGIGVDESLFQGASSLGLTGDSPLTRGDVASVLQPTAKVTSGGDFDWAWAGFGAGMAALLAAAMAALYLSARHRDRVALP